MRHGHETSDREPRGSRWQCRVCRRPGRIVLAATLRVVGRVIPASRVATVPALCGVRAGCATPGVACAAGAEAERFRRGGVRFSDLGGSRVRSGSASQNL